jgi:hypothetical protein
VTREATHKRQRDQRTRTHSSTVAVNARALYDHHPEFLYSNPECACVFDIVCHRLTVIECA